MRYARETLFPRASLSQTHEQSCESLRIAIDMNCRDAKHRGKVMPWPTLATWLQLAIDMVTGGNHTPRAAIRLGRDCCIPGHHGPMYNIGQLHALI